MHSADSLEEWYRPGSRPDGLAHRSVQYTAGATPAAAPGAATSRPQSAVGHARPSAHLHRTSVATAGWAEAAEQEIACIREQYSSGAAGAAGPLLERCYDLAEGRLTLAVPDPAGPGRSSRTYGEGSGSMLLPCHAWQPAAMKPPNNLIPARCLPSSACSAGRRSAGGPTRRQPRTAAARACRTACRLTGGADGGAGSRRRAARDPAGQAACRAELPAGHAALRCAAPQGKAGGRAAMW